MTIEKVTRPPKGKCNLYHCNNRVTNMSVSYGIRKDGSTYGTRSYYCYKHYLETHQGLEVLECESCGKMTIIKIDDFYNDNWDGKWQCTFCKNDNNECEEEDVQMRIG